MVENLWSSVPHQASGSLAEKGRIENIVRMLSQSPTARGLLEKAHEKGIVMALSSLASPANSMLGVPRADSRMLILDPQLDDAACAAQVVQQLAAGSLYGCRPATKLSLRAFSLIQHTEIARAHGAAMTCQVAHELKEGHSGYRNGAVWQAVKDANPALARAYAAAAVPGTEGMGQAAGAAFDVAISDPKARARTEDQVMNQLLKFHTDEQAPGILFRTEGNVVASVEKLALNGEPYVRNPQSLADPKKWAVDPGTADKIRFFEQLHMPGKVEMDIPVRTGEPQDVQPGGLRGMLGKVFNGLAVEVAVLYAKPKLQF
ncbi:MAG: hypothetical protein A2018_00320 [Alphaproteobacteria bacterium GWF2_58_20]|nr:MAG: hypothetical protein A2018_00320 [Alphaproteobacteria bacterium GWF2_58_20]